MATIGSLLSSGYGGSNSNATSIKNEITSVKDKMKNLDRNSSLSSEERTKLSKEYNDELKGLNEKLYAAREESTTQAASNASNLANSLFGSGSTSSTDGFNLSGTSSAGQTGFDFFFGANGSLASLKAVNSARMNIENRARTLTAEIAMDKKRGVDTTGKQGTLANLTANLSVMDSGLSNNINSALSSDDKKTTSKPAVIDKINQSIEEARSAAGSKTNYTSKTDKTDTEE